MQATPKAVERVVEANSRGRDPFDRKDYLAAFDAYTQVQYISLIVLVF